MPRSLHILLLVASGLQFITVLVPVLPGTVNLCAVAQPVKHPDMKSFPPESSYGTSKILPTREINQGFSCSHGGADVLLGFVSANQNSLGWF